MKLRFENFRKEDFEEYKSWYQDEDLNRELGPMNEEWLHAVLEEKNGQEYSIFLADKLVAVAGVKFPSAEHNYFSIADIAVKPNLRNKRIGSQVLQELVRLYSLKPGQFWRAVVNVRNTKAKSFLENNGWVCKSEKPDEYGMITMELK